MIRCGSCPDCLDHTKRVLTPPRPRQVGLTGAKPPTRAALERHGERFGWAGVAEVAAQHGISVTVPRQAGARGSRGPTLKQRVATMVADGHSADFIAEVEDLSPSRARRLVAESTPS